MDLREDVDLGLIFPVSLPVSAVHVFTGVLPGPWPDQVCSRVLWDTAVRVTCRDDLL